MYLCFQSNFVAIHWAEKELKDLKAKEGILLLGHQQFEYEL